MQQYYDCIQHGAHTTTQLFCQYMARFNSTLSSIYRIFSHTVFPHTNLSKVYYGVSEKHIEHHYHYTFTTRSEYYEFPIRMKRLRLAYSQRCVCVLHLKRICVRYEEKKIKSIFSVFDCQIETSHFYVVSVFSLSFWLLYRQEIFK